MPNYSKIEQDMLDPEQLELIRQSRPPALGQLDDAALYALLERLRAERDAAGPVPATDGPGPADVMRAAHRRVDTERRRRGLSADAVPETEPAAIRPAAPLTPKITAATTTRRKAATTRKPAGRKTSEARKTDLRTEPHRVKKPQAAPVAAEPPVHDHLYVTRDNSMTSTDAEKAARKAARKAEKETAKTADKAAEKAAAKAAAKAERQAAKAAEKDARRAARKAEKDAQKEAAKAERKAARKAEKQAEKQAAKQTAHKPGSKDRNKASDEVKAADARPGKSGDKVKPSGGKAAKADKPG